MQADIVQKVKSDPKFAELVSKKTTLGWVLTILMLIIYFGFVLLVALNPDVLRQSLTGGVITVRIPMGIGVIVSAFILAGIYVYRANGEFDELTKDVVERATK